VIRPLGLGRETLPTHPQWQVDELLSSWILRLAWANDCKVHTLCSKIAGNQHTVWNRDVDRMAPAWLIDGLGRRTGKHPADIRSLSLSYLMERIDERHHPRGNGTWVLPLGIWHRKRLGYGTQFCPLCLRMDEVPYVRRSWRLAYYTECERHAVLLMDRCPNCAAPFDYFRGELGDRNRTEPMPISICRGCGYDLAYAQADRGDWADWNHQVAVRTLLLTNDFGWTLLGSRTFESASELLGVIRYVITLLSSPKRAGQLYDAEAEWLFKHVPVLSSRGKQFELRNVAERHRLFGMAVWSLLEWPSRFQALIRQAGLRYSDVMHADREVPAWFKLAVA
jgi:hypothetical protein